MKPLKAEKDINLFYVWFTIPPISKILIVFKWEIASHINPPLERTHPDLLRLASYTNLRQKFTADSTENTFTAHSLLSEHESGAPLR